LLAAVDNNNNIIVAIIKLNPKIDIIFFLFIYLIIQLRGYLYHEKLYKNMQKFNADNNKV
jgi:hypothetical protein